MPHPFIVLSSPSLPRTSSAHSRPARQPRGADDSMYLECALHPSPAARAEALHEPVLRVLSAAAQGPLVEGQQLDMSSDGTLASHVRHIRVFDVAQHATGRRGAKDIRPPAIRRGSGRGGCGDGESIAFQLYTLPALEFDGLWESLVYEEDVQPKLLRYVSTAMAFSAAGVDDRVIAWNRVVLLHGPPGTGKTSLCRGLAHKLAVRLSHTYAQGHLIEVNAHSLFSKWFSESGKMVMAMFARIRELLDDGDAFVCVLVDEVESLAAARASAANGSEPSDAIRVVNALLTQLDGLKRYKNALVLTTSNLTGSIDAAFIDRADLKQYIGPPGPAARYEILRTCVHELGRVGLVAPFASLLPPSTLLPMLPSPPPSFAQLSALSDDGTPSSRMARHSMLLHSLALACDGLSGRALRKLPFLAHALFGGQAAAPTSGGGGGQLELEAYLGALHQAIEHERDARGAMAGAPA